MKSIVCSSYYILFCFAFFFTCFFFIHLFACSRSFLFWLSICFTRLVVHLIRINEVRGVKEQGNALQCTKNQNKKKKITQNFEYHHQKWKKRGKNSGAQIYNAYYIKEERETKH